MHYVIISSAIRAGISLWNRVQGASGEELQAAAQNLAATLYDALAALRRKRAGEDVDLKVVAKTVFTAMSSVTRLLAEGAAKAGTMPGPVPLTDQTSAPEGAAIYEREQRLDAAAQADARQRRLQARTQQLLEIEQNLDRQEAALKARWERRQAAAARVAPNRAPSPDPERVRAAADDAEKRRAEAGRQLERKQEAEDELRRVREASEAATTASQIAALRHQTAMQMIRDIR